MKWVRPTEVGVGGREDSGRGEERREHGHNSFLGLEAEELILIVEGRSSG